MIDHDRLFKELITTFFIEFIELFFPQVTQYLDSDYLEFLDKELFTDVTTGEKQEVDLIAKEQKINNLCVVTVLRNSFVIPFRKIFIKNNR
jgi:hypothetical protein